MPVRPAGQLRFPEPPAGFLLVACGYLSPPRCGVIFMNESGLATGTHSQWRADERNLHRGRRSAGQCRVDDGVERGGFRRRQLHRRRILPDRGAQAHAGLYSHRQLSARLPGLEALKRLETPQYPAPVLVMSSHHDIPTAVMAIRNGAQDFIEKPFDPTTLVIRIRATIQAWRQAHGNESPLNRSPLAQVFPGHERLTAREREVLEQIARGASNRETGHDLGISPRTVEVHRAHHGQAGRQECRRPDAHCAARGSARRPAERYRKLRSDRLNRLA